MTVRLATRASDLALAQANLVAAMLREKLGVATELVPLETSGDRLKDVHFAELAGGKGDAAGGLKGLFVKEIEDALLEGRADLAVHSAKDLPAVQPGGLLLAAFPERADPRDALLARERGASLDGLPVGARVGTGSARRSALLRERRPDLELVPLRGNVPTRLRKLESENLDAVILACAGLERLGLAERIDERIAPDVMLPAVAQGVLALQVRVGDPLAGDLTALDHPPTSARAEAERAVLTALGADCNVPLAAYAEPVEGDGLRLRALLAHPDGSGRIAVEGEAPVTEARQLGADVAQRLLSAGGAELLAELRREVGP